MNSSVLDPYLDFSVAENAVWLMAHLLVIIPNLVGNTLVCVIIKKENSLHTFTYFLLSNLSVADILTGIFATGEAFLFTFLHRFSSGPFLCKVVQGGMVTKYGGGVSLLTLTLVSMERYYSIVKPLDNRRFLKKNKLHIVVPILWIAALSFILPANYERYVTTEDVDGCFVRPQKDPGFLVILIILIGVVIYIVTMGIMVYSFYHIRKVLWGQNAESMDGTRQGTLQARKQVVKILATVIISFNMFLLPHLAFATRLLYSGMVRGYRAVNLLAIANSGINPIIYFFQSPQFKKSFKARLYWRGNTDNSSGAQPGRRHNNLVAPMS